MATPSTTSTTTAYHQAMHTYLTHHSAPKPDTSTFVLSLLRSTHPSHHITKTTKHKCDLLNFALAGHAVATPSNDSTLYDSTRLSRQPHTRLQRQTEPSTLYDDVAFGRWVYVWEGKEFLVFGCSYIELYRPKHDYFYVLAPKINQNGDGKEESRHHPDTDALLLAVADWSAALHNEIYVFDDGSWEKDRELFTSVQDASWDDVILNQDMKDSLIADVQGFFDNQALYKKLAVPWKRGVILHGVPGNGKTISIKALINSLSKREDPVPSLYVKSFDNCNGPKRSIRSIFSHARTMAPCILIFEDLDSLVTAKTRSYFLNEVDGLESNDGILMIGSTNHLEKLDPAISKRPSRFDRKYHFRVPDVKEREAYARFWRGKLEGSEMVAFPEELCAVIAGLTEGFSFAYLKELFVIALMTIARGTVRDDGENEEEKGSESSDGFDVVMELDESAASDAPAEPTTESKKSTKKASKKATKKVVPKKTQKMPEIEVPEELKENLLFRAIKAQTKTLLEEMDNSEEDDWEDGQPKTKGAAWRDYQRQLARLGGGGCGDSDCEDSECECE
ncbi:hypothetical protein G7Y89_g6785 [Cudoniella acicularis]|uniref:AAA+ ATPase domain-containing protein n=1 Tax=Cudoniella acicularis TaxID=354080 RepID=A0A8H4RM28_9HELO|nr:hypothetical protein G7Y89_g6785 [Cudoniella acicularis]